MLPRPGKRSATGRVAGWRRKRLIRPTGTQENITAIHRYE